MHSLQMEGGVKMQGEAAIRERLQTVCETFDIMRSSGQQSEYLQGVINALLWVLGEEDGDPIRRPIDAN